MEHTLLIERARPGDLPSVLALLARVGLPPDGLAACFTHALVARDGEQVVGSAALEVYGDNALLRSVAVAPKYQGQGLGRQLATAALELAADSHVVRVYLLTDTAGDYFPRLGFRPVAREAIAPAVQASVEFTSVCPQSARVMEKELGDWGVSNGANMARGDGPMRVLILCTGNSARSQMAEALLRARGGDSYAVYSAGTEPKGLNPLAVAVMAERGIDISTARSKGVDEFVRQPFDYVITVCDNANETCPVFPGAGERLHHSFEDPAAAVGTTEARLAVFRRVRDAIDAWLGEFVAQTSHA